MLDRYLWGKVERISPEAPVPIVDIYNEENRLGGAGNVALNLRSLGATPVLCGLIGNDADGIQIKEIADNQQFDTNFIQVDRTRRTTVKVRIIGNHQQVLRVDKEDRNYLSSEEAKKIIKNLEPAIKDCQGIIFQDYNKGLLTPELISGVMKLADQAEIPVMVDPKFHHFFEFSDSTLFKPNLKELNEGLGLRLDKKDPESIAQAAFQLRQKMPHQNTLITLSENGMLLIDQQNRVHHMPTHVRQVVDVSGAGDTVIAVAGLGMAAGLDILTSSKIANVAAGLVCEELGVVPVNSEQLRQAWEN